MQLSTRRELSGIRSQGTSPAKFQIDESKAIFKNANALLSKFTLKPGINSNPLTSSIDGTGTSRFFFGVEKNTNRSSAADLAATCCSSRREWDRDIQKMVTKESPRTIFSSERSPRLLGEVQIQQRESKANFKTERLRLENSAQFKTDIAKKKIDNLTGSARNLIQSALKLKKLVESQRSNEAQYALNIFQIDLDNMENSLRNLESEAGRQRTQTLLINGNGRVQDSGVEKIIDSIRKENDESQSKMINSPVQNTKQTFELAKRYEEELLILKERAEKAERLLQKQDRKCQDRKECIQKLYSLVEQKEKESDEVQERLEVLQRQLQILKQQAKESDSQRDQLEKRLFDTQQLNTELNLQRNEKKQTMEELKSYSQKWERRLQQCSGEWGKQLEERETVITQKKKEGDIIARQLMQSERRRVEAEEKIQAKIAEYERREQEFESISQEMKRKIAHLQDDLAEKKALLKAFQQLEEASGVRTTSEEQSKRREEEKINELKILTNQLAVALKDASQAKSQRDDIIQQLEITSSQFKQKEILLEQQLSKAKDSLADKQVQIEQLINTTVMMEDELLQAGEIGDKLRKEVAMLNNSINGMHSTNKQLQTIIEDLNKNNVQTTDIHTEDFLQAQRVEMNRVLLQKEEDCLKLQRSLLESETAADNTRRALEDLQNQYELQSIKLKDQLVRIASLEEQVSTASDKIKKAADLERRTNIELASLKDSKSMVKNQLDMLESEIQRERRANKDQKLLNDEILEKNKIFQREAEQLSQLVREQQSQHIDLEQRIQSLNGSNNVLSREYLELKQQKVQIEMQLQREQRTNERIIERVTKMEEENNELKINNLALEEEIIALKEQIREKQRESQQTISQQEKTIELLKSSLENLNNSKKAKQDLAGEKGDNNYQELLKIQEELDALKRGKKQLSDGLSLSEAKLLAAQKKTQYLEEENEAQKKTISQERADKDKYENQLKNLLAQNAVLAEKEKVLRDELVKLRENMMILLKEKNQLATELEVGNSTNNENEKEKDYEQLKREKDSIQTQPEQHMKNEIQLQQTHIEQMEQQVRQFNQRETEWQEILQQTRTMNDTLNQDNKEKANEITQLKTKIAFLSEINTNSDSQLHVQKKQSYQSNNQVQEENYEEIVFVQTNIPKREVEVKGQVKESDKQKVDYTEDNCISEDLSSSNQVVKYDGKQLESSLSEITQQLNQKIQEIEQVTLQQHSLEQKISEMSEQQKESKVQIEELNTKQQREIAKIKEEFQVTQDSQLNQRKLEQESYESTMKELTCRNMQLEEQIEQLEKQIVDTKVVSTTLSEQNQQILQKTNQNIQALQQELETQKKNYHQQLQILEEKIQLNLTEYEQQKQEMDRKQKNCYEEINQLKETNKRQTELIENYNNIQISKQSNDIEEQKNKNSLEIESLKNQMSILNSQIQKLQKQNVILQKENASAQKDIIDLEEHIKALQEEIKLGERQYDQQTETLFALEDKMESDAGYVEHLESEMREQKQLCEQLEGNLENKRKQMEKQDDAYHERETRLSKELQLKCEYINTLENAHKNKQELVSMQTQQNLKELKEEVNRLRSQLEQSKTECQALQNQKRLNKEQQQVIKGINQEKDRLEMELQQLQDDLHYSKLSQQDLQIKVEVLQMKTKNQFPILAKILLAIDPSLNQDDNNDKDMLNPQTHSLEDLLSLGLNLAKNLKQSRLQNEEIQEIQYTLEQNLLYSSLLEKLLNKITESGNISWEDLVCQALNPPLSSQFMLYQMKIKTFANSLASQIKIQEKSKAVNGTSSS